MNHEMALFTLISGQLLELGTRIILCIQDKAPPYADVSVEGRIIDIAEDDLQQRQISMAI